MFRETLCSRSMCHRVMHRHGPYLSVFSCCLCVYSCVCSCVCFRWYFAVISVSGVFAVTFSVVFAYVADITQEHERSMAYGLVSSDPACSV